MRACTSARVYIREGERKTEAEAMLKRCKKINESHPRARRSIKVTSFLLFSLFSSSYLLFVLVYKEVWCGARVYLVARDSPPMADKFLINY